MRRFRLIPTLLPLALSTLLWQGCDVSRDEDNPPCPETDSRVIAFDIDSNSGRWSAASRGDGTGVTTTANIRDFRVSAFTDDQWGGQEILMDSVTVRRTGVNTWTYSPTVEWPDKNVDFYAVSPAWVPFHENRWWAHYIDYASTDCETDLLIATRIGVHQTSGTLRLNFRHTLARVTVSLRSTQPDIRVEVCRVSLHDIGLSGRFIYRNVTTSPETNRGELFDQWSVYNLSATRLVLFDSSSKGVQPLVLTRELVDPCPTDKFLIPVTFTRLNTDNGYVAGSRIEVVCRLVNTATGAVIWPDSSTHYLLQSRDYPGYGIAMFSLSSTTPDGHWLPGVDYRYTLTIDNTPALPRLD